jgi:hypothetical protein
MIQRSSRPSFWLWLGGLAAHWDLLGLVGFSTSLTAAGAVRECR